MIHSSNNDDINPIRLVRGIIRTLTQSQRALATDDDVIEVQVATSQSGYINDCDNSGEASWRQSNGEGDKNDELVGNSDESVSSLAKKLSTFHENGFVSYFM